MYYIYIIQNELTKELYVGSSKSPFSRWKTHLNLLEKNGHNKNFQNAYNSSKLTDWIFRIIEDGIDNSSDAFEREEYYRNKFNCTLNGTDRIYNLMSKKSLDDNIIRLIDSGKSYREVSCELGCSIGKISNVIKKKNDRFT